MNKFFEQLFFHDSRQELLQLVQINSLEQLQKSTEITLHSFVHNHAKFLVRKTIIDLREYWAIFGCDKQMNVQVRKEGKGNPVNLKKLEAKAFSGFEMNPLEMNLRVYFDHPATIFFHTHPKLTTYHFKSQSLTNAEHPKLGSLRIEQIVAIKQASAKHFSSADLSFMESSDRYVRSMLLSSIFGQRLIINPSYDLKPLSMSRVAKNQQSDLIKVGEHFLKVMKDNDADWLDIEEYDGVRDALLIKFCNALGLIAFGNNNYENPTLKRLN